MKYSVWNDGGLYHARNLSNIKTAAEAEDIPRGAVLIEAATGSEAIQAYIKTREGQDRAGEPGSVHKVQVKP